MASTKSFDLSVYLVSKPFYKTEHYFETLEKSLQAGVSVLQWREKNQPTRDLFNHAKDVQKLAQKYDTPFIVNDRLDIALALDADGLHIGQEDLPTKLARQLLGPEKWLGVSASTLEEARQAELDGADYLGVGSVFPTGTKLDATLITMETLSDICEAISIPVVAIGGITLDKTPDLIKRGASGVAIISSIWDSPDPENAVKSFNKRFSL